METHTDADSHPYHHSDPNSRTGSLADRHSDANTGSNSHTDSDADSDSDTQGYAHANFRSHPHAHAHCFSEGHPNAVAHYHAYADSDCHGHGHGDSNAHSHANRHTYRYPDRGADSLARDTPTATVQPLATVDAAPGDGCSRPTGRPTVATALANLALLAAPLALAAGLRRRRS